MFIFGSWFRLLSNVAPTTVSINLYQRFRRISFNLSNLQMSSLLNAERPIYVVSLDFFNDDELFSVFFKKIAQKMKMFGNY